MKKLWGDLPLDERVEEFTVGNDHLLDQRLIPYDATGSIAHVRMLGKVGLLNNDEVAKLVGGLEAVLMHAREGAFPIRREQEDCHTAIEHFLTEQLGEVGKKLHLGRSRNDQVLTALRLYYKDAITGLRFDMDKAVKSIRAFASQYSETQVPGYSHMRKAMPSSIGLWARGYADCLKDNEILLQAVFKLIDQSPLGTGAGYGVPLPLDRSMMAQEMGFSKVQENPVHVQLSRGKGEASLAHACSQIMLDLNRCATDLILFSMDEFSYFELPQEFTTGSSMMPQKQNPDVLELIRARYHQALAYVSQLQTILGNLPSGYNRDLQLTKEPVFYIIDLTQETLAMTGLVFESLKVNPKACKEAMTEELYAAEKAYKLSAEKGIPFRDAYLAVKNTK